MAEYQTFEHDVIVIGAGGAGLRASIEAASTVFVGPKRVVNFGRAVETHRYRKTELLEKRGISLRQ